MVTPPKPTEGSEQSHSVSSGTIPDPQDLEKDIQLASTGLPSTHDEGTHKSQPLSESTATHPKDSEGNKQPLDTGFPSMTFDEGTTKTTPRPEGSLGDKDSGGNIPPADMEPMKPYYVRAYLLYLMMTAQESEEDIIESGEETDEDPLGCSCIAETHPSISSTQAVKPQSYHAPSTKL
ncbi:hypothetical protein Tco_1466703 [Tanacetum coccineum]